MANMGETTQGFAGMAASKAQDAWDTTRQQAQQWGHQAQDIASTATDQAQQAWDQVSRFFGRYPVPMFFLGIGLGFLMARAFGNWSGDMTDRMSRSPYHS